MRSDRNLFIIIIFAICIIVGGCTTDIPTETTEPTEDLSENRPGDIQLGVTELKLSDLEDEADEFYFRWNTQSNVGFIERIYVADGQGWYEYYETEPFPADFLDGGVVKVRKSYANTFNSVDYETFAGRFAEMEGLGKVVDKAEFQANFMDRGDILEGVLIFCDSGNYTFLHFNIPEAYKTTDPETEDGNLTALLNAIRRDRGTDIAHKLLDKEE